jgi:hypothetical protein
MAVWYIAQEREILCDLDNYMRPAPSKMGPKGHWGEVFWRRRLSTAMRAGKLDVCRVWLERSNTHRHWHAIILLAQPMPVMERLVWQLRLGSDLMRGQSDLMRAARGIPSPSLLIRNTPIKEFYREPDRVCRCMRKHDTDEQYRLGERACAVWRELRGMTPWELFGEPYHGEEREVPLPEGEVPLELILKVETD